MSGNQTKHQTGYRRAVDRRRILAYAASEEERAKIVRDSQSWARHAGVPSGRALSGYVMACVRMQTDPKRLAEAVTGSQIPPALKLLLDQVIATWDAEPYDHRTHADAVTQLASWIVCNQK